MHKFCVVINNSVTNYNLWLNYSLNKTLPFFGACRVVLARTSIIAGASQAPPPPAEIADPLFLRLPLPPSLTPTNNPPQLQSWQQTGDRQLTNKPSGVPYYLRTNRCPRCDLAILLRESGPWHLPASQFPSSAVPLWPATTTPCHSTLSVVENAQPTRAGLALGPLILLSGIRQLPQGPTSSRPI